MSGGRVGKGGELGTGEMIAVHGDKGRNGGRGLGGVLKVVEGVEAFGDEGRKGGFAWGL